MKNTLTAEELCRKHGICSNCGELFHHHLTEPFASCACCTSEWSGQFTPHMVFQSEVREALLNKAIGSLG